MSSKSLQEIHQTEWEMLNAYFLAKRRGTSSNSVDVVVKYETFDFTGKKVRFAPTQGPFKQEEELKYRITPEKQKEIEMTYNTDCSAITEVQTQRKYLSARLMTLAKNKEPDLLRNFGLTDDKAPMTFDEAVQRIKDGKYTVVEQYSGNTANGYYGLDSAIRWRDPAKKEDKPGYDAAKKLMAAAVTDTQDAIMIKTPDEALAAVKAFEAMTFI